MFREWGFLLSEMWGLLALAALVGLLAGWLIWGRRQAVTATPVKAPVTDTGEADRLRADLNACTSKSRNLAERIDQLERELTAAKMRAEDAEAKATVPVAAKLTAEPASPVAAQPAAVPASPAKLVVVPTPVVPAATQRKPQGLSAARGGAADDLKLIKGIGPALEKLCNKLGFYHFDQLSNWTAEEIAWVDENLEGFKGRVTRDDWVAQARDLAAGKPPRAGGEG